ncbi:ribosomal protein S5 domain 2-type protein [Cladochytrium replicatum]|nr:ribosomal protein S5 domain 2-type protein [Cladochytrium replicatum]
MCESKPSDSVRDELSVLESIYGDDCNVENAEDSTPTLKITLRPPDVPESHFLPLAILNLHLPTSYPDNDPPFYTLEFTEREKKEQFQSVYLPEPPDVDTDVIADGLDSIWNSTPRPDVVIYEWVEWLRGHLLDKVWNADAVATAAALMRASTLDDPPPHPSKPKQKAQVAATDDHDDDEKDGLFSMTIPPDCPPLFHSATPLVDRKSVFIAHLAQVRSAKDVALVKTALLSSKRIARATHNISAYRIKLPSTNGLLADCDDDGETAAGGRLLHLLELTGCVDVLVVVSRWYGGIQLGPMRFKHINNIARELLEEKRELWDLSGAGDSHQKPTKSNANKKSSRR